GRRFGGGARICNLKPRFHPEAASAVYILRTRPRDERERKASMPKKPSAASVPDASSPRQRVFTHTQLLKFLEKGEGSKHVHYDPESPTMSAPTTVKKSAFSVACTPPASASSNRRCLMGQLRQSLILSGHSST